MAANSAVNLNGRIEKTDLKVLLRSVEKDKLTGELSFNGSGQRIDLYFLFGQLYHAKWKDITGIDAVMEVLGWKAGTYSFTEGIIPAQGSISEDIDRILASAPASITGHPLGRTGALPPMPSVMPVSAEPLPADGGFMNDLMPFDLASLDNDNRVKTDSRNQTIGSLKPFSLDPTPPPDTRHAPSPPADGLYRTRYFCLPTGEQMATSLVATGPQLEEELLHLADVGFTGYVLGGPEVDGYAAAGICLFRGRFIHAFYHMGGPNGVNLIEGEKAYRTALDQSGSGSARFYWFYELTVEAMRAAISLLTPPTRYAHLEVRIVRFKELLRMLSEESHTGCVRITIPTTARNTNGHKSTLAGERAYIPIFQGAILGLWTEKAPRMTNDGQMLQRFLGEPQAFLDLHMTAPVAEPGMPLESLIGMASVTDTPPTPEIAPGSIPAAALKSNVPVSAVIPTQTYDVPTAPVDDDERQLRLITTISRMESTWVQMQKKGREEYHTSLLGLAGFANEVLSLNESVSGRKAVQESMGRSIKQELAPYRQIFQLLDVNQGRVNIIKLLKEYEQYSRQGEQVATDYYREASRGLRTLIRTCFQNYVALIRQESIRFECQEMSEIFLQDVVKRI